MVDCGTLKEVANSIYYYESSYERGNSFPGKHGRT